MPTNIDYERLFEESRDLVLVLDPRWRILAATDAYLTAKHLGREAVLGQNVFDVLPPEAQGDGLRNSLERALRSGRPDAMGVHRRDIPARDGGPLRPRLWTALNTPILDGFDHVVAIVHRVEDVTEFAEGGADTDRDVELARMRREIMDRSQELAEANRGLHAANEAKNEFLARMSHEMRSPLTAVMGFSELLGHSDLDGRQRDRLAMIRRASEHLLRLLNEVLDLSRIETGNISISLESVPVVTAVEDALALMHPLAAARSVELHALEADEGCTCVIADNQRLQQVLLNLVSNAIKYNRDGGEVRIRAELRDEGIVRLTVADTGRGLARSELERLFVPFERLDAGMSDVEGTGLGLVLARTLVEAMGGCIGVESEVDVGTRFWIELASGEPVEILAGLLDDDPLFAPRSYDGGRSILYVEDTLANVRLVEGIAECRPGLRVLSATHGLRGQEIARREHPDLILLDLHLPDLPGEELLARLRADPETASIPVVVLSADATRESEELLAAGASAFLTKPIAVQRLLGVIDRFLVPAGDGAASPALELPLDTTA